MKKRQIELKKEKNKKGLSALLSNKKTRYLTTLVLLMPFIIAIVIFGSTVYREGKRLMNLAQGNTAVETKPENIIESMGYVLRDNPTDVQKEYFAQLKSAIEDEHEEPVSDEEIAGLVAKNYVVDFYTWTNKYGKYDVGGMEYIYDGEYENSDHYKDNIYLWAKDGFYKYMSSYASKYGKENLLEVEDVTVSSKKMSDPYIISVHDSWRKDENEDWYDYRVDTPYEWYNVQCSWTYKATEQFDLSKFSDHVNLAIIKDENGVYYIVEASEDTIKARNGSAENSVTEAEETEGETDED